MADKTKKSDEKQQQTANFLTRPETRVLYSDFVNLNVGAHGLKIYFGVIQPGTGQERVVIEEQCSVGMSAEHAKSLYDLLGKQLALYEERHGAIRTVKTYPAKFSRPAGSDEDTE